MIFTKDIIAAKVTPYLDDVLEHWERPKSFRAAREDVGFPFTMPILYDWTFGNHIQINGSQYACQLYKSNSLIGLLLLKFKDINLDDYTKENRVAQFVMSYIREIDVLVKLVNAGFTVVKDFWLDAACGVDFVCDNKYLVGVGKPDVAGSGTKYFNDKRKGAKKIDGVCFLAAQDGPRHKLHVVSQEQIDVFTANKEKYVNPLVDKYLIDGIKFK